MKLYTVDFKESGQTVGFFTYDIRASSVFDAVCELFNCCGVVIVTCVTLIKNEQILVERNADNYSPFEFVWFVISNDEIIGDGLALTEDDAQNAAKKFKSEV